MERLLEAFAFLAARVHLKLDDDFPEITEALLGIVYPHLIRPIPSMSIVEFQVDLEQGKLTTGLPIPRDTMLYSRPVAGVPCKFRTSLHTTLWPIRCTGAEWKTPDRLKPAIKASDSPFALRLELASSRDAPLPALEVDYLRFHLFGESALIHSLYELLCCKLNRIVVRDPGNPKVPPVTLPASALRPVGFAEDEAMIPYPRRSFLGYRVLQEFFALPSKYLFVDITGLKEIWGAGFKNNVEFVFLFSGAGTRTGGSGWRSGSRRRFSGWDACRSSTCSSSRRNRSCWTSSSTNTRCGPTSAGRPRWRYFRSIRCAASILVAADHFVPAVLFVPPRTGRSQAGVLLDCEPAAVAPAERRRVGYLPGAGGPLDACDPAERGYADDSHHLHQPQPAGAAAVRQRGRRFRAGGQRADQAHRGADQAYRPLAAGHPKMAQWHLISHLSLNYLSLVEGGRTALQQILRLYDFTESPFATKMIEGISGVESKAHFARVVSENGITFARGTRVELELDEEQFVGGGVFLFASVIEQFLALYASMNSFTQLTAKTRQGREVLKEWPPRAGQKILL